MELRTRCGYSLGVAGAVVAGERILMVRRMHEPNRGRWTFPSGWVGATESVDQAVVREIEEETGVRAEVVGPRVPTPAQVRGVEQQARKSLGEAVHLSVRARVDVVVTNARYKDLGEARVD